MVRGTRAQLAEKMAGEVALSDDPGATLRKWRTDFEVPQTELADHIGVSPSVISDYESGRRDNPGIGIVRRLIDGLLDVDEQRGGEHIRQHARVLSAGFDSDVVHDLREYSANVGVDRVYEAIGAEELTRGGQDSVAGHTVINSIAAITRLSSDEFYQLYGQSTNRALVFTNVTRGESPLVALRVVSPTPNAVILHGLDSDSVWEHAEDLARIDDFSLAVTNVDLDELLAGLRSLP
ncbi:helix-turn-helix domain-containing protein [Halomicroarcula sp. GCM10025324]|uniref:helix-turn-helix domain-containing protein n=1 Tax=Haloarcula TaxID=2237 RepID=UPI0023E8A85C|nr:helix-turn-helix domain-containing protein [Halomicroarcula sp. ZS-22-S1]